MDPSPSPEERFRQLFHGLDAEGGWTKLLPAEQLARVRTAASSPLAWRAFLAGNARDSELQNVSNEDLSNLSDNPDGDGANAKENAETKDGAPAMLDMPEPANDLTEQKPEKGNPDSPPHEANGEQKPTPASSPRPGKGKAMPLGSPGRRTPLSSPRKPRESPNKTGRDEDDHVAVLSAIVRRRLAIASIDEQMFHNVHGALPEDDERYEIDQGMLPGDDGGYASFEELEREETETRSSQTSVYVLLGSHEDVGADPTDFFSPDDRTNPVAQAKERTGRSGSTPKRPRRTTAFGLSEHMECFIRELRELCEPHRDAAQEESAQKKAVPKNIHRKAVSAASVVEELKEMEHKAHIGKYERVEECISAVSACIGNQDETFAEVLTQIEDRADVLREEYQLRKQRYSAMMRVKALTTGVLGSDADLRESTDEEDDDEEMCDQVDDYSHDAWIPARRAHHIPFAESELHCWPPEEDTPLDEVRPDRPRLPIFESESGEDISESAGNDEEIRHPHDNLVTVIGADNQIVKNVVSLHRVLKLREQAFAGVAVLRKRSASRVASSGRSSPQKTDATPRKMEDVLTSHRALSGNLQPRAQTSSRSARNDLPSESNIEEIEIKNDAFGAANRSANGVVQEPRERALGRSVVALMFAHGGFTHASSLAVEVLTDVLENFVERIGHSLISCRENIDQQQQPNREGLAVRDPSEEEIFEELRIISSSGFRGRFPGLECYAKHDIPRCAQALRVSEIKLEAQLARIDQELSNTATHQSLSGKEDMTISDGKSRKSTDEVKGGREKVSTTVARKSSPEDAAGKDLRLDDAAFTFGYLSSCVSLDVLGAIKVPRKLAFDGAANAVLSAPVPTSLPKSTEKVGFDDKAPTEPVTGKMQVTKMDVES